MVKNKRMKKKIEAFLLGHACFQKMYYFQHVRVHKKQFGRACSLNSTPVSKWLIMKYSERSICTSVNVSDVTFPPYWKKHTLLQLDDVNRS